VFARCAIRDRSLFSGYDSSKTVVRSANSPTLSTLSRLSPTMPFSRFIPFGVMFLLLGQARGQSPDFWRVSTRACPQILGSDPGPFLQAFRLDSQGCVSPRGPAELQLIAAGRPIILLVHGSYYTAGMANTEGLRIGGDLARGAVTRDAIIVEFDWRGTARARQVGNERFRPGTPGLAGWPVLPAKHRRASRTGAHLQGYNRATRGHSLDWCVHLGPAGIDGSSRYASTVR
jgi:hypothetical protein